MKIGERMAIVETEIKNVKSDTQEIKETLNNFIKSADRKYANKLTEKIVYGMVSVIILAFLYALVKYVIIGGN